MTEKNKQKHEIKIEKEANALHSISMYNDSLVRHRTCATRPLIHPGDATAELHIFAR